MRARSPPAAAQLRELEGLSYRELADVMEMPIGSVMSGLSRGRQALRKALNQQLESDCSFEMRGRR